MSDEKLDTLLNDLYDDSREEGLLAMARDFYNRRMLSIVITMWVWGVLFMALAVFSAVMFFRTDPIRYQIMYAVIFLTAIGWVGLIKILAWQIINRNNIKRELKRLELRVAQLANVIDRQAG